MTYFFDTSALKYRYVEGTHARSIKRTISDPRNECHISEFSILEISGALASRCRDSSLPLKVYDRMDRAFWKDIHAGYLKVRTLTKRDLLRARYLLHHASRVVRKLTTVDAVVVTAAMELALESSARVTLCLEDKKLYTLVRSIPAYASALRFKYIGPPV